MGRPVKPVVYRIARRSLHRLLIPCILLSLLPALAQGETGDGADAGWKFHWSPLYLWFPAIHGELTVRDVTVPIDVSTRDFAKTFFKNFRFAFTSRFEAHKGPWVTTLDFMYMKLKDKDEIAMTGIRKDVTTKLLLAEFGGGYRVLTLPMERDLGYTVTLELLGGGRVFYLNNDVELGTNVDVSKGVKWIEPFVGGRLWLSVMDYFDIILRGDAGGFNLGSNITWALISGFQLHVSKSLSVNALYRLLDIDYDSGSGPNLQEIDLRMRGPQLGATLHF